MKSSLRVKLLASFMLLILVVVGGSLAGISLLMKEHALTTRQQELRAKGTELAATLGLLYQKQKDFTNLDSILADADSYLDARVWVLDKDRHVINVSGTGWSGFGRGRMQAGMNGMHGMMRNSNQQSVLHGGMHTGMGMECVLNPGLLQSSLSDIDEVLVSALKQGSSDYKTYTNKYYGEKMLAVAVPVLDEEHQVVGTVLFQEPVRTMERYLHQIYVYLGIAGLAAFLVALLLVLWLTRYLVKPLTEMETAATAIAQGDYRQQVTVKSTDEVGRLGQAINSLARDLEAYINRVDKLEKLRRDFAANVSHELRTPLTIIRGYDEALLADENIKPEDRREYCQLLHEETLRLEQLINDLLDLSRLQGTKPANMELEPLPLNELAASLIHKLKQQAQQKGIELEMKAGNPEPCIKGNGNRMLQVLLIFLDNALKYTPAGGKVLLITNMTKGVAKICIADTGRGIPSEDLPYVWERFYKVDKSHSRDDCGTGLGLAIAREILFLHRADVKLESKEGQGTKVTISFPATTI